MQQIELSVRTDWNERSEITSADKKGGQLNGLINKRRERIRGAEPNIRQEAREAEKEEMRIEIRDRDAGSRREIRQSGRTDGQRIGCDQDDQRQKRLPTAYC